jgi:hypothetical protein
VRKCGDQRASRRFVFNELSHFLFADSWRSCSTAWPVRVGRKNENRAIAMFDFVAIRISFGVDFAMVKFISNRAMSRLEMRRFVRERPGRYPGAAPATAAVSEPFIVIAKQGTVPDFYGHRISVEIRIVLICTTEGRWESVRFRRALLR